MENAITEMNRWNTQVQKTYKYIRFVEIIMELSLVDDVNCKTITA